MRCCAGDEGFVTFGAALRREASNRLMLRWLETVVVSDGEKASGEAPGGDREGERKRIVADVSKPTQMTSEPGCFGHQRIRAGCIEGQFRGNGPCVAGALEAALRDCLGLPPVS